MRKVWVKEHSSLKDLLFNNFVFYRTKIINKMGEHLKIIEYPEWVRQSRRLSTLWGKLPNSGNLLKLLIPNLDELLQGGWINYSCKVTSQKMAFSCIIFSLRSALVVCCITTGLSRRNLEKWRIADLNQTLKSL